MTAMADTRDTLSDLRATLGDIIRVHRKKAGDVQFVMCRHGETDFNVQQRLQGHLDVPLNPQGRLQAQALAEALQAIGLQAVLTSDLSRAQESGQIIASALGLPQFQDQDLREANLGQAQGMTYQEIEQAFGTALVDQWHSRHFSDADVSFPDGESGRAMELRCRAALQRFSLEHPDYSTICVISHGGIMRRFLQSLCSQQSAPLRIANAVPHVVGYSPVLQQFYYQPHRDVEAI